MTELHAGLDLYRDQLRHAIAQQLYDQRRARRRARRAIRIGGPACAALAASALALTFTGGSSVSSADAAILRHVAAELSSPPATILHERALVTASGSTAPYELWAENVPPYHYHVLKWGHEGTGTTKAPADDFAAEFRALVQAQKATVDGTATINGVAAYKLTVSGAADRFANGTAYVAQSDYRPLEIDTTGNGGERIVFQTYEYLPATAANLQQVGAAGSPAASEARR